MGNRRTPSIIIAGVQKCGTTALYDALCRHGGIKGPAYLFPESSVFAPKELHYFNDATRRKLGKEWYESHFDTTEARKMEATPEYCISRRNVAEMAAALPDAQILLVLREPLARLLSAWQQWSAMPADKAWPVSRPRGSLLDNVSAEMGSVMDGYHDSNFFGRGLYYQTLRLLHQFYPASNVRVVFLEELVSAPAAVLPGVLEWLRLPVQEIPFWPANTSPPGSVKVPARALRRIWQCYQVSNQILGSMLGRPVPWSTSWEAWKEARQRFIATEESGEKEEQAATQGQVFQAMRSWLLMASQPPAQRSLLLERRQPRNPMLGRQRVCNAVASGVASDADIAALLEAPFLAHELVPAIRSAIEGGVRPSAATVKRLSAATGPQVGELFRLLVANGLEDVVAECWNMEH